MTPSPTTRTTALHNPDNPYILVCDRPKIATLRKEFPDLFQEYTGH